MTNQNENELSQEGRKDAVADRPAEIVAEQGSSESAMEAPAVASEGNANENKEGRSDDRRDGRRGGRGGRYRDRRGRGRGRSKDHHENREARPEQNREEKPEEKNAEQPAREAQRETSREAPREGQREARRDEPREQRREESREPRREERKDSRRDGRRDERRDERKDDRRDERRDDNRDSRRDNYRRDERNHGGDYRRGSGERRDGRFQERRPQQRPVNPKPREPLGKIKLYGDRMGDGVIQLSFTLPAPKSEEAKVAAVMFAEKMGLKNVHIIHMEAMGDEFTFFVVYANSDVEVDMSQIQVPKLESPQYDFDTINDLLKQHFDRKIVVLGACIGSDAHTVGIDAIFNMKGYLGSYGLERYPTMQALNLRAQVDTKDLVKKIVDMQADAVLISRVVTQRDEHIIELKKFLEELNATPNVPKHLIKICGGPRISHQMALEIGYDAGFGPGTLPSQVASYITTELFKRLKPGVALPS